MNEKIQKSIKLLFSFCMIWTIILMVFSLGEFLKDFLSLFEKIKIPSEMVTAYISLLTAYAGHKEINRWTTKPDKSGQRLGEIFVYIWWAMVLLMFVLITLFPLKFQLPEQMMTICLGVLIIFFGSEANKIINLWFDQKKPHAAPKNRINA